MTENKKETKNEIKQNENTTISKVELAETEEKEVIEVAEVQSGTKKEPPKSKKEEETAKKAVPSLVKAVVLTPIFYEGRHEIGDVIEVPEKEFEEFENRKLVAKFKE